jgi:hypothetical protein
MHLFRASSHLGGFLQLFLLAGLALIPSATYAEETIAERFSYTLKPESQELVIRDLVTGESHQLYQNTSLPQRDTAAGLLFSDREPHQSISEARVIVRVLRPQENMPPKFRLTKYELK